MSSTNLVDFGLQITLAAGVPARVPAAGSRFALVDASGPITVTFYDAQNQQVGRATGVQAGLELGLASRTTFAQLESATSQTITYAIANGDIRFNRITGTVQAEETPANGFSTGAVATIGAVATTLAAPADAVGVLLQAAAANTGTIYVGATVAGQGFALAAGGEIVLGVSAAVPLIASGAGQNLSYLWLTRS